MRFSSAPCFRPSSQLDERFRTKMLDALESEVQTAATRGAFEVKKTCLIRKDRRDANLKKSTEFQTRKRVRYTLKWSFSKVSRCFVRETTTEPDR